MDKKILKNQESKKVTMGPKSQPSKTPNKKGENPVRVAPFSDLCSGSGSRGPSTWLCRNAACRAVLSVVDTFCKRCSCCMCHSFDDNKDPSLWLECASDSSSGSCGLSCHIDCALQQRKVGVVDVGQVRQLDGSYCCASCGKISGILGFWKKQLTIAKDCRRVDNLCYRVYLSFRLLDGTSRFQALHQIVQEAKELLETEVGPLGGVTAKLARGIVSRLSVAAQVQALCKAALQKADESSATPSSSILDEGLIPAAFNFNNNKNNAVVTVSQDEGTSGAKDPEPDSALKARDLGKMLQLTWVATSGPESSGQKVKPNTSKADGSLSKPNRPDLNIKFPDPNEDIAPSNHPRGEADHRSGGSENWAHHGPNEEVPAIDSRAGVSRKRPASTEAHDSDSALVHISPLPAHTGPNNVDQNFEYCVKVIRGLENEGHITREFRLKLLTWFGLRSTAQERRVVNTFIQTLGDDPRCLAEQLVDSFSDIITNSTKKPRPEF